jgi:hypothetical protein
LSSVGGVLAVSGDIWFRDNFWALSLRLLGGELYWVCLIGSLFTNHGLKGQRRWSDSLLSRSFTFLFSGGAGLAAAVVSPHGSNSVSPHGCAVVRRYVVMVSRDDGHSAVLTIKRDRKPRKRKSHEM